MERKHRNRRDDRRKKECRDALDKFKRQHPGVWEEVLKLFGDWKPDEDG